MEDYQKRAVLESAELQVRIDRLNSFLLRAFDQDDEIKDLNLLKAQLQAMKTYKMILDARIENF
jgi:hypothetical protein